MNKILEMEFNMPVIIDIAATKCKICKLDRSMWLTKLNVYSDTRKLYNSKINCLYTKEVVGNLLLIGLYYAVVDSSFFPDKLELILVW